MSEVIVTGLQIQFTLRIMSERSSLYLQIIFPIDHYLKTFCVYSLLRYFESPQSLLVRYSTQTVSLPMSFSTMLSIVM
jgi:hypothetical protein